MNINLAGTPLQNNPNNRKEPILIAGPCSAESREQMLSIARDLKAYGKVNCFRAGIWKPRTRPGAFEGVGEIGLEWLREVKNETGLAVACEVATPQHIELALKYGIDVLWIGARTTVNPFSIQDIADCLSGTDTTVMVKNPVNPDLQIWIGALERLSRAGISRLAAIHRGFTTFEPSPFRNDPMWNIAIELRSNFPNLPIICDPSHIAGVRDLIPMVAQKAIDLDMYGLMVEVHNSPCDARSDAFQQLTSADYIQMIDSLRFSDIMPDIEELKNELSMYRHEIDMFDNIIIEQIAKRMKVAQKIGIYKRDNNIKILQINRWEEMLQNRIESGESLGLNHNFVRKILELLHQESITIQTNISRDLNKF